MRKALLPLLLCLALLTSCAAPPVNQTVAPTLPPAVSPYDAPYGDETLRYTDRVALYLPSRDGQKLIVRYEELELRHDVHSARAILEALLRYPAAEETASLGGGVNLSLYGSAPVEVSGGVCTVNLSASALQLDRSDLYTVCLAIASTLCELPDIQYVNVLILGQAIAMDITGCLPLGTISPRPGEELPVLWEQMDARRAPLGQSPATVPVNATATLYFPLADGSGIVPETRALSFPGQDPQQLALELTNALSAGAQYAQGTAAMPSLGSLLTVDPIVTDLEDGGRLLTLRFNPGLEDRLRQEGIDMTCFLAAVHRTLVTFIPLVSAVRVYVGDTQLTSLYSRIHGSTLLPEGVMLRSHFDACLMRNVTLYMPGGSQLTAVERPLHHSQADSLLTLLEQLMAGPTEAEASSGLSAPLPPGLTEEDVLGLGMENGTLLINLSSAFAQAIRDGGNETLICYSMVNTLCEAAGVERARFFFDGQTVEALAGTLYWGGEFLRSPGLIH
ncbi:MAG: GerMN domain-containing protein [Aristaeellaceae bacterium]